MVKREFYLMEMKMGIKKLRVVFAGILVFSLLQINSQCEEPKLDAEVIYLDENWEYAPYTSVHNDGVFLYRGLGERKNIVIAINPGHGTTGASGKKVYCHPDKSPKTTSGSTNAGLTMVSAQSVGMQFNNKVTENEMALKVGKILKNKLLVNGYDVLMLRETKNIELDLLSRTLIANHVADYHISLHYDGDGLSYDKGAFYISVPKGIKKMPPVDRMWEKHDYLGQCLIDGLRNNGVKIFSKGYLAEDLMQTSFSTIPSVDLELGNQCSKTDAVAANKIADGILEGINKMCGY